MPGSYAALEAALGKDRLARADTAAYPCLEYRALPEGVAEAAPLLIRLCERPDAFPKAAWLWTLRADGSLFATTPDKLRDLLNIQNEYLDAEDAERENIYNQFRSKW